MCFRLVVYMLLAGNHQTWKEAMNQKEAQESRSQLERIFNALQDGVIACDHQGKILRINAAALKLFEVASESLYKGKSYHRFLHSYQIGDGQPRVSSLEPWMTSLILNGEASTWMQQELLALQVRSGRKIYVNIRRLSRSEERRVGKEC